MFRQHRQAPTSGMIMLPSHRTHSQSKQACAFPPAWEQQSSLPRGLVEQPIIWYSGRRNEGREVCAPKEAAMPANKAVFISHADEDDARCRPLLEALREWGIRYWYDKEQVAPGDSLPRSIRRGIDECDVFLRICTPAAQGSPWMRKEREWFVRSKGERNGAGSIGVLVNIVFPGYQLNQWERQFRYIDAMNRRRTTWLKDLQDFLQPAPLPQGERFHRFFQKLCREALGRNIISKSPTIVSRNAQVFQADGLPGISYWVRFGNHHRVYIDLYISRADGKALFDALARHRSELEAAIGEPLEWDTVADRKACRVSAFREGSIDDDLLTLEDIRLWALERLDAFKRVLGPKLSDLLTTGELIPKPNEQPIPQGAKPGRITQLARWLRRQPVKA